jgi:hypothetical protein
LGQQRDPQRARPLGHVFTHLPPTQLEPFGQQTPLQRGRPPGQGGSHRSSPQTSPRLQQVIAPRFFGLQQVCEVLQQAEVGDPRVVKPRQHTGPLSTVSAAGQHPVSPHWISPNSAQSIARALLGRARGMAAVAIAAPSTRNALRRGIGWASRRARSSNTRSVTRPLRAESG